MIWFAGLKDSLSTAAFAENVENMSCSENTTFHEIKPQDASRFRPDENMNGCGFYFFVTSNHKSAGTDTQVSALHLYLHAPSMLFFTVLDALNPVLHSLRQIASLLVLRQTTIDKRAIPADIPHRTHYRRRSCAKHLK